MKYLLTIFASAFFTSTVFSQEKAAEKPVEMKISGFVMNNMVFDTRRNVDAVDGMILLFPLPQALDSLNEDLNRVPNLNMLSLASRLKFGITGPDAFGAKTSGSIELDFTARANCATVRFRQAWVKLNWQKAELLVGRTWHPMASMDVIPSVMALSMGAPFQPFNRSEQITFTRKMGKTDLIVSAIFQNDYVNNGPVGKTYLYQNNAIVPNLHLQLRYKGDYTVLGLGIDYKRLRPRTFVESPVDKEKTATREMVDCGALLAYAQYKKGKFSISGKTVLAANTSESLMTGAFAISDYDTLTGYEEYTTYKHFFLWGNATYGSKLKASLFAGYLKNLGAGRDVVKPSNSSAIFGLGENIGQYIRVVPTVSYTSGKTTIALELEQNIVQYGTFDYANKGKIIDTKTVNGTRLLATILYNF